MKEAKESKPEIPELVSQKYVNVRKISQKRISEEYGNPAGCLHGVRKDTLNLKPGTKFFIGETKKRGKVIESLLHINEEDRTMHVITFHYKNGNKRKSLLFPDN